VFFRGDDEDEIIENSELEPVTKFRKQRTTWSKKQPNDNTSYHYVLPDVRTFSKFKFFEIFIL
jgi:hypothetical protein